jgi:hypothetical protein
VANLFQKYGCGRKCRLHPFQLKLTPCFRDLHSRGYLDRFWHGRVKTRERHPNCATGQKNRVLRGIPGFLSLLEKPADARKRANTACIGCIFPFRDGDARGNPFPENRNLKAHLCFSSPIQFGNKLALNGLKKHRQSHRKAVEEAVERLCRVAACP